MIASGPIVQSAWVVEDLDATEAFLGDHFGVRTWVRLEGIKFGPETCTYRGRPADFVADISLSYAGDLQLELIRPVSGKSIYTEFLTATSGPGLHHVCFETEDLAESIRAAEAAGLDVVQTGSMAGGAMEFAYIDGAGAGAPYIEVVRIGPDMRAFFNDIKEQVS
jgi:catechol 2,3-dioxygenase-like lactoylglutathione lyase family enzyme